MIQAVSDISLSGRGNLFGEEKVHVKLILYRFILPPEGKAYRFHFFRSSICRGILPSVLLSQLSLRLLKKFSTHNAQTSSTVVSQYHLWQVRLSVTLTYFFKVTGQFYELFIIVITCKVFYPRCSNLTLTFISIGPWTSSTMGDLE